mmetsp:Transcript_376/g.1317  ORF Transcript_376/g.1317 Transcript_376/m.1317 type:complete len:284 (-) Transcript_376:1187-2038(-)
MPKRLSVDRSTPTPLPPPMLPPLPSAGVTASMPSAAEGPPRPPTVAPALPGPPRRAALPPAPPARALSPRGGSRPRAGEPPEGGSLREAAAAPPRRAAAPVPRSLRPKSDEAKPADPSPRPSRSLVEPSALCGGTAPAWLALDRRGVLPPPLRRPPAMTPSATARRTIALPWGTACRKDLSRSFSCTSRSFSAWSASIRLLRTSLSLALRRATSFSAWASRCASSRISLALTLVITRRARSAKRSVEVDSSAHAAVGLSVATTAVRQLPPTESCSRRVSFESR